MSKKTTNIDPRLKELTDALINDLIDEQGREELEALLHGDAAAKEFFTTQCHLHTALSLSAAAEKSVDLARVRLGEGEAEKTGEKPTPARSFGANQQAVAGRRLSRLLAHPVRFVAASLAILVIGSFAVYGGVEFWQDSPKMLADWLPSSDEDDSLVVSENLALHDRQLTDQDGESSQSSDAPQTFSFYIGESRGESEPGESEPGPDSVSFDTLSDMITETIEPSRWDELNGPGSIEGFESDLDLVVGQTQEMERGEDGTAHGSGVVVVASDGSVHRIDSPPLTPELVNVLAAVNESAIPYDDSAPIQFPDTEVWKKVTEIRLKLLDAGDTGGLADLNEMITGLTRAGILTAEGIGPGQGGDQYDYIPENSFEQVDINPLSTFSIDVDTASYSKVRMYLMQHRQLPPAGAIRLEELINYFRYEYPEPEGDHPVATHVEVASCPWQPDHRLVRVGVQARHIDPENRPPCNLVFLLDVSGSMSASNKLELVKAGFERFVRQLREEDRVAIVVYAGSSGLVLPSTSGDEQVAILESLNRLKAGGSTNGGAGIALAYSTVRENFIEEGVNRIILCTDGDFNVGETSTDGLVEMAAEEAKDGIYLTVLGFGMGNHNDAMLESLSNNAEGNYAFIDTLQEANKVLVEQMNSTLVTLARDVKIQIEFNPALVQSYRLIGYENRMLAEEDFNDDTVDAGEIGAGHTVTALYELVPVGIDDTVDTPEVTPLRYQRPASRSEEASSGELLTVNLRYKHPDAEESTHIDQHVMDDDLFFNQATAEFQFAAAVAEFGLILRHSQYAGDANYAEVLELATDNVGSDEFGYRGEFLDLVRRAAALSEQQASSEEE